MSLNTPRPHQRCQNSFFHDRVRSVKGIQTQIGCIINFRYRCTHEMAGLALDHPLHDYQYVVP